LALLPESPHDSSDHLQGGKVIFPDSRTHGATLCTKFTLSGNYQGEDPEDTSYLTSACVSPCNHRSTRIRWGPKPEVFDT
jgi:hypothetical protein